MRKYILLMMALLLLATIMPATADVPSDVPAEHWAVEAVRDLYNRGIFIGYPDDSFRGDRAVTRYELAVVLSRLLKNLPSGGDTSNFVTKTELQNTLKSYPTKTELQTTLNNYLTKAELQNTLNNYVTKTEFENRLANLATKEDIARLQRLVDNLRTDLTALGVRVDEVQRRLAALETRVGKLEERVTLLEQRPAGGISFNMIGGVAARNASVTDVIPGFEDLLVNEYDRPLVEGFSSGAAFDIMVGAGLTGSLGIGARVFAVNEDLTDANLENFDTNLGFFLTSDDTRLDLGVFDAEFTPFTLANGSESVLEQIPAFYNYWYFNGAKLSTNLGVFDTQLLISNTRDRDVNESQYDQTLFGARAAVKLSNTLGVAGNYVFINDDDAGVPIIVETGALPAFKNRVWSVNADLVAGSLGVYGEFADSRNEDIVNGGTVSGNAYKIGAMVGPVDAYYLKIGGVTDPFIAYYGDPAAATLFNGHDPGMGGFLDPARRILYFGQQPNLFYSLTAPRYDLNNNIRGYGATVGFNAGSVATNVLPSPVFISAILRLCSTIPPNNWTSKWRRPIVRTEASRTNAKASGKIESRSAPFDRRSFNSTVLALSPSSGNALISGSRALITPTIAFPRANSFSPLSNIRFKSASILILLFISIKTKKLSATSFQLSTQ
jgi:uncharacterized coiled-coil protein SlyX